MDICGAFCDYLVFAGLMVLAAAWFGYFAYRYSKEKESGEPYGELQELGQSKLLDPIEDEGKADDHSQAQSSMTY